MTEPSGSHVARKRVAAAAELSRGFRAPAPGREERLDVPPDRPSDPGSMKVRISWLQSIMGPVLGAAVAGGVIYGATLTRIEQLEARDVDIAARLERVGAEAQKRHDELGVRVYAAEREAAVRETEQRATTRALEALTDEIREMRSLLQRRQP